jgi:hypothetical protein
MTSFKFLAAATILSALIASSASAQPVIDEPGMYAFYHPNGDLGMGSSRPSADAQAMAPRLVMRHPLPARQVRSAK